MTLITRLLYFTSLHIVSPDNLACSLITKRGNVLISIKRDFPKIAKATTRQQKSRRSKKNKKNSPKNVVSQGSFTEPVKRNTRYEVVDQIFHSLPDLIVNSP